jgi:TolA-binding protein
VRISRLLLHLLATVPLAAQSGKPAPDNPAAKRPEYRQAVQALKDRLPEVAVARLKKLLASGSLRSADEGPVKLLLAEALVRTGSADEALAAAAAPETRDLPEAGFWRGAAMAQLQRYAEAEQEFAALPPDSKYATEAAFSRASVLRALGQTENALALLRPLAASKEMDTAQRAALWSAEIMLAAARPASEISALLPEQVTGRYAAQFRYLRARLALAGGSAKTAAEEFAALSEGGRGIPPLLAHAAALGRARALQLLGQKAEALGVIEKLIGMTPTPPGEVLLTAFDAFEKLNVPPGAEADNFLKIWAKSEDADLSTLARLAAAAALEASGRIPEALAACQALSNDAAQSPWLPWVLLREAKLSLADGNRAAVAAIMERMAPMTASPGVRAWAAWLKGSAAFDAQQFAAAAKEFTQAAAEAPDLESKAVAAFDAALAELQSGVADPQAPLALLDSIGGTPSRVAGAEFHLERALYMAAAGMAGARDGLTAFVEALPQHPRKFQALAALVELALQETPPRAEEINARLAAAEAAAGDPASRETAAWLRVLAAEKTVPPDEYVKAAVAFIESWPQSERRAPLRMRLGEMYYRRQNFAAARQQWEQLAKDEPQHAHAEAALFWAARAALQTLGRNSSDEAIALWEQVYKRGGALKLEARLQVALLKQRRNDHAGALQILDGILATRPPPDPATRRQALCSRGEILVARSKGAESLAQGLAAFDEVVADPQMLRVWKHEALVRKGDCLEQIKRPDEALEAWHAVLSEPPGASGDDDYWYQSAGRKVVRMLEESQRYEDAVVIAEKMAAVPGPRGQAAGELVNQLCLKYGIWREMKKQP